MNNNKTTCPSPSIALDPLYPSRCSWETFGYATGAGLNGEVEGLSPLSLSGQLNTLACSVTFHQGESVSMVKLIEQVRHVHLHAHRDTIYLFYVYDSLQGASHYVRHPQELPVPIAVSADPGPHPGERENMTVLSLAFLKY